MIGLIFGETDFPKEILAVNFQNIDAQETNFSNKIILRTTFQHSNLQNSNFEKSHLSQFTSKYQFSDIELLKSSPEKFILQNWGTPTINIISAIQYEDHFLVDVIEYVNFAYADLSNGNFEESNLVGVDFSYVNLSNANFINANLENARLQGANLQGANLQGANLQGANLNCVSHEICN